MSEVGTIRSVSNKHISSIRLIPTKQVLGLVYSHKPSLGDQQALTQMASMMRFQDSAIMLGCG
jgi:hypothetical protein